MLVQGRVVKLDRGFPLVETTAGQHLRCKHATAFVKGRKIRAVIGDIVELECSDGADMAQIVQIMPRRNEFVRKDPTERALPQVLAANFDTVVVVHPACDLNVRRLERELVLAHETGARVVVALTKADLAENEGSLQSCKSLVKSIVADSVDVLVVSLHDDASVEALRGEMPAGTVAVLTGRSGVGKSSLVNSLAGEQVQETTPVRQGDGKGRHTTVSRSMVQVQDGGLVVDMPGVRSLGLWESERGISAAFPDVYQLASQCRFRNCKHENEPGCAVRAAVECGSIPQARVDSFCHLMQESDEQRTRWEEAERIRNRTGHPSKRSPRQKRRS